MHGLTYVDVAFAFSIFIPIGILFILVAGFAQMGQYLRQREKTKGMSLLKQYVYHCHMLGKIKKGSPDPWGRYYKVPTDWGDIFAFSCLGLIWILLPFGLIAAIMAISYFLVKLLFMCSTIGLSIFILCIITAITAFCIAYYLYALGLGWLQMLGSLGKFDEEEVDKSLGS
jgi:hypothetical protein